MKMIAPVAGRADISRYMGARKARRFEDAVIHSQDRDAVFTETRFMVGTIDVLDARPVRPFDSEVIEFLAELSSALLADVQAKAFPDVISFAFWCRRSNLVSLEKKHSEACEHGLGRGRSLHIAPANVPVNFAFSFAFSHLAGNVDIVRVPSREFPQVDIICRVLSNIMKEKDYTRAAFLRWPSDSSTTEKLSQIVDSRIIWGGNKTVGLIRSMASKPRCLDIAFPDRYSLAIIHDESLCNLSDKEMAALAKAFYNDTYLMDQNACSSPQVVAWLGHAKSQRKRFWNAVSEEAHASYDLQGAISIDKYVHCFEDAIEREAIFPDGFDGFLSVVSLNEAPSSLDELRGVGGYFYDFSIDSVVDVVHLLDQSCQTITYFGLDPNEIRDAVFSQGILGVDRIVPFGKAMDIGVVWDGFDLVDTLSRRVEVI